MFKIIIHGFQMDMNCIVYYHNLFQMDINCILIKFIFMFDHN